MKQIIKKFLFKLPFSARYKLYGYYCSFKALECLTKEKNVTYTAEKHIAGEKIKVLFYHISGLHFGGTEKFLQILAKHLDKNKFEVFFVYSSKSRTPDNFPADSRRSYLEDTTITLLPFDYKKIELKYPFYIHNASPTLNQILNRVRPHMVISTGTGYPEYPLNLETRVPIIMLNNFGASNTQKNVVMNICVSQTVANLAKRITPAEKIMTMYVQSERPYLNTEDGSAIRRKFGIADTDTLFGRIGRASDDIFDPIGILAFEELLTKRDDVHYVVMSAPPALEKIVAERNIKNVHFLPASGYEKDVWAFHSAIDVLAHFRLDGESFGLNIAESMLAGNPIITHKSDLWNAHLEYLDDSFARVVEKDDYHTYASYMLEFTELKNTPKLKKMCESAQSKAQTLFLIENNISSFENIIIKATAQ